MMGTTSKIYAWILVLPQTRYSNREGFAFDVRLIFDNCSFYNEDNSQVSDDSCIVWLLYMMMYYIITV